MYIIFILLLYLYYIYIVLYVTIFTDVSRGLKSSLLESPTSGLNSVRPGGGDFVFAVAPSPGEVSARRGSLGFVSFLLTTHSYELALIATDNPRMRARLALITWAGLGILQN